MKQRDLARALDVSPSYLCKVEKGLVLPTESFMNSCAAFLGEPVASIFPQSRMLKKVNYSDKSFHNNLWAVRNQKNIKQNKLAEILGCSPSYLSKVEKGIQYPNEQFKKKCAKILKTKVTELFPDISPVLS